MALMQGICIHLFNGRQKTWNYLTQLKNECEKNGVKSLLIMVDGKEILQIHPCL
jgi:hypothetical protein